MYDSPPTEQPWKSWKTIVTLSDDGTLRVSGIGSMQCYPFHTRYKGLGNGWRLPNTSDWNALYFDLLSHPIRAREPLTLRIETTQKEL